jgi:hypothetical protein
MKLKVKGYTVLDSESDAGVVLLSCRSLRKVLKRPTRLLCGGSWKLPSVNSSKGIGWSGILRQFM